MLEYCTPEGLPLISWSPVDIGALAQSGSPLSGIAAQVGATPAQISLAGCYVAAAPVRLSPEQVAG